MRDKLLFVESNTSGTGMLALEKSIALGYYPVMLTNNPKRYLGIEEIDCQIIVCNTNELEDLKKCIETNFGKEDVAGIMTTSEFYIVTVAKLNEYFSYPFNSPESMLICRNKANTRKKLREANVNQPKFMVVTSIDDIEQEVIKIIGFPCVVKPVDDSGSNNVTLCETIEQVTNQIKIILNEEINVRGQKKERAVLIEQYLNYPEYSVEMFTFNNKTYCIGITEKKIMGYPYFVEYQHIFKAKLPSYIEDRIKTTVEQALDAVGITFGATHTEVKLMGDECAIIEINARLAGGMIPKLVEYVTGIDLLENQIRLTVGQAPNLQIEYTGYSGIRFITAEKEGVFRGIKSVDEIEKLEGLEQFKITYSVGKRVGLPQNAYDRLGYFIVKSNTYEEVRKKLNMVVNKLDVVIEDDK